MFRREFLRGTCAVAGALGMKAGSPLVPEGGKNREFYRGGMRYRRLGNTDLFVSALGFGAHTDYQQRVPVKGSPMMGLREDYQELRTRQTDRALDLGVNLVDVYDEAGQYEPLAKLASGKRDKILIATKFNEFPGHVGRYIDHAAKLFGHVDVGRYVVRDDFRIPPETLENWDLVRKAKAAGKIRAIGVACHSPAVMMQCLRDLEGIEFIFFPYNFIHAQASYTEFIPAAQKQGVGLIAMKPLASGSIVQLDPRRPRPRATVDVAESTLDRQKDSPLLAQAVAKLLTSLNRSPEETLAQAALRFVFSQPAVCCALAGMFLPEELEENYQAFETHARDFRRPTAHILDAAREVAELTGGQWLPPHYRWLDEQWRPARC